MGRPREFDVDDALETALQLFWRKGYEGTSLSDLTEAMGITRPSLYSAFGNKETLYRKAQERYSVDRLCIAAAALAEPTSRAVVEKLLLGLCDVATDPHYPGGCMAMNSTLACGEEAETIRHEQIAQRKELEAALAARLEVCKAEGDLPAGSSPADLARYVMTVFQGLAVQAGSGAGRDELRAVVAMALRTWPG